ncbi:FGGY-family carbohydrate kinase [Brucella pseudogrignonensis]|uniref:Sugar (Pentulose or hexulose) kinase n=1 Tax=Brucella pseudogrignonensis TaxID=419475 RepID=A0ABU1MCU0_9HYPH|nr:FGGY-family carbohydrate kinase [Brucella pseudogrignonensis]MDR6433860.1 sugar (pentulose or hexulose) kinase [Brucella pseudogrignonensis]
MKRIAILDIGKTNAKAVLLDAETGSEITVHRTPNKVLRDGPYPHHDIEALWQFFLKSLTDFAHNPGFDAISITTHGACAALLNDTGKLAMPVLDYEHEYTPEIRAAYARIKPPFAETFSPSLGAGLNLGAQLHYLKTAFPEKFANVSQILTYPQYWAYRLTSVPSVEATSLGCHTDLWLPKTGTYSSLVETLGLEDKFPPLRSAFDVLGQMHRDLSDEIGLSVPVPVYCGIHDSNASLLAHLLGRDPPFSVVSTGTWVVCFAVGGDLEGLDPKRDTLANVDAYGRAVPSARYMGGREFDIMTDGIKTPTPNQIAKALDTVIKHKIMALPAAISGSGPYPNSSLRWINAASASLEERYVATCLYAALMTATCLDLLKAGGPTIVEGPFAKNPIYLSALSGFTERDVTAVSGSTGTALGAGLLAGSTIPEVESETYSIHSDSYLLYREYWANQITT